MTCFKFSLRDFHSPKAVSEYLSVLSQQTFYSYDQNSQFNSGILTFEVVGTYITCTNTMQV